MRYTRLMDITGGSFGVTGFLRLSDDGETLLVGGPDDVSYARSDVTSANASSQTEKKFGIGRFILLAIVLIFSLGFFIGAIGWVIGLVVAVFASFYTETSHSLTLQFSDGKNVELSGNERQVSRITEFINKQT